MRVGGALVVYLCHARRSREHIALVTRVLVKFDVAFSICLYQRNLIGEGIGVIGLGLVDVPNREPMARKFGVTSFLLPVLDQEILLGRLSFRPEPIACGLVGLESVERKVAGRSDVLRVNPSKRRQAP